MSSELIGVETAQKLDSDSSDDTILALVRRWVDLLAEDRYEAAFRLTAHSGHAGWSPQLMRAVIAGYGHADRTDGHPPHRVTPIASAHGGPRARHDVNRWHDAPRSSQGDRGVGDVWFDLPLDGEWSDLTATFDILVRGRELFLVLEDIHVH